MDQYAKLTRESVKKFCDNFAYSFVSSECMMPEFRRLSCKDAQEVKIHLLNSLDLDLQDWLEEVGISIDD